MSNSPLITYTNLTTKHSGKRNHIIDTITIHCYVAQVTAKRGCDYFATTDRKCSANYVVGLDGSIGLSVDEANRSWCTSSSANDNRAVTIEVASEPRHPYAVTDAAYEALIKLVADICKRNGIKKLVWSTNKNDRVKHLNGCNMTVHRDYANKDCPGEYLYERHGAIAEAVNKLLGATAAADKKPVKIAPAMSKDDSAKWGVRFKVTAKSGLNFRSSASAKDNSNLIKTLETGTKLTWYGYYTGDFYLVQLADKSTGYVHKAYLAKA